MRVTRKCPGGWRMLLEAKRGFSGGGLRFTGFLVLVLGVLLGATTAGAREPAGPELDLVTPLQRFLETTDVPGVSVAVLEKGRSTPRHHALGQACVNNPVPMEVRSVVKLGSVTKMLTALRVLMLAEAGQLDLDATVEAFFPDFPHAHRVTPRQMLSHTAGLPEVLAQPQVQAQPTRDWSAEALLALVAGQALEFEPGSAQRYSNTGYLMLGRIIEAVGGEDYATQITREVAAPLGMHQVLAGDDRTLVPGEACGHTVDAEGRLIRPLMTSMSLASASGDLLGTARDVVRLVNMGQLLRDSPLERPAAAYRLADGTPAQREERFPAVDLAFVSSQLEGLALYALSGTGTEPRVLLGKDGLYPGYASWFLYDPLTETAVAVVINHEMRAMEAMRLAIELLDQQRSVSNAVKNVAP